MSKTHFFLLMLIIMCGGIRGLHAQTGCLDCLQLTITDPVNSGIVYVSWQSQGVSFDSTLLWAGDTLQVTCQEDIVLDSIIAWDTTNWTQLQVVQWVVQQVPDTITMYQVTTDPGLAGVVDTMTANNCTVILTVFTYAPPDPDEGACGELVPLSGVANDTFRITFNAEANGTRVVDFEAYGIPDRIEFWSGIIYHGGATIGTDGQFQNPILWNGGTITEYPNGIPSSWDFKIPGAGDGSARFILNLDGYCELTILVISNPTNPGTAYELFVHCCDDCTAGEATVVDRDTMFCKGDQLLAAILETDTILVELGKTTKGCDSLTIWDVTVPLVEITAFDVNEPSCHGFSDGFVQVLPIVSDAFDVLWETGSQTTTASNLAAGMYTVTITDINGCDVVDSVIITQPTPLEVSLEETEPRCFGEATGMLIAIASGATPGSGYEFVWNSGWDDAQLVDIPSGSYVVTVTDANGCEKEVSTYLGQPDSLQLSFQTSDATCTGITDGTARVQPFGGIEPYNYLWSNGADAKVVTVSSGEHFVTITDANGCEVSGNVLVEASQSDQVYVPNGFSPNGDGINDVFTAFSGQCVKNIRSFLVFDRWGEKIFEHHNFQPNSEADGWNGFFKNTPMQPGVYAWWMTIEYFSGEVELRKGDVTIVR